MDLSNDDTTAKDGGGDDSWEDASDVELDFAPRQDEEEEPRRFQDHQDEEEDPAAWTSARRRDDNKSDGVSRAASTHQKTS
eukprot:CAMPEP_0118899898 /NCGR_PEP_ID=MMETSP1166-20130328/6260_1 /TAXON_ID=1104430 /ORGANISM="Chrysoreinhardia sp, Strain CCMP3193" /LENGTH=80 /DNA_ID=CAMNT_0006839029 /DNA_START=1 /DNA_END=240 /DNA_ORIENTATION=+